MSSKSALLLIFVERCIWDWWDYYSEDVFTVCDYYCHTGREESDFWLNITAQYCTENSKMFCRWIFWTHMHVTLNCSGVCPHLAKPPQDRLAANRYPPTIEAWAAPASPELLKTHTSLATAILNNNTRKNITSCISVNIKILPTNNHFNIIWSPILIPVCWFCWPGGGCTDSRQA